MALVAERRVRREVGRQAPPRNLAPLLEVLRDEARVWCGAARGLAPQAQAKIEKELQSRLDESLARAIQEQEGGGAAAAGPPDDIC